MHLKTDTGANAHFATVPTISKPRNSFSIAEKHCSTMQFDYLYPMFHKFIYPGDTLSMNLNTLARLQTQIRTLFDDLYIDAHAWFVPLRLIQTNWSRFQFNTQTTPGQDNTALTTPNIDLTALGAGGFVSKGLYDYFGYPTKVGSTGYSQWINNYLARGYNLIWNTNYRDENLQNPVVVDLDDGPDVVTDYVLLKRGKRHDLFTSSLTAPQKGPNTSIPLGSIAPVLRYPAAAAWKTYLGGTNTAQSVDSPVRTSSAGLTYNTVPGIDYVSFDPSPGGTGAPGLYADLSAATAANLNQFRQSVAVQHLLEADARGGTRDVESIAYRWGVQVPDFRLQRPEYLGGTTWSFDGHVVPQTSATVAGQTPQATLTQFSQSLSSLGINHSFVEHGVFMILFSARSNITYQEGLQKELSYKTRYDFYQPEFANLGEVAVKNKEIYFQGTSADDDTFGYQEYAYELRYGKNRVSGEMRSNYTTSLDSMHLADDYSSLPTLSAGWISSNTAISRNIAVSAATADPIQLNMFAQGRMARTLPMFSIPGLSRL